MSRFNRHLPFGRGTTPAKTYASMVKYRVFASLFALALCIGCGGCLDCNQVFPVSASPSEVTRGVEVQFEMRFDMDFLDPSRSPASQTAEITLVSQKTGTQSILHFYSWAPESSPEFGAMQIVDRRTVRFALTVPSDFDVGDARLAFGSGSASSCEAKGGSAKINIR